MFLISSDKVYFALFEGTLKRFYPLFCDVLLKYARCAACNGFLKALENGCDCSEYYPDSLLESEFSLFHTALGTQEFEKQNREGFPDYIGVFYVWNDEYNEFLEPAFKKHLRKAVYQPKAQKIRKERIEASPENYNKEHVLWLKNKQFDECYYCGSSIKEGYHIDHLSPLGLGGYNNFMNIALACKVCNLSKHSKPEAQFWREMKKKLPDEMYKKKRADAKRLSNDKKIYLREGMRKT